MAHQNVTENNQKNDDRNPTYPAWVWETKEDQSLVYTMFFFCRIFFTWFWNVPQKCSWTQDLYFILWYRFSSDECEKNSTEKTSCKLGLKSQMKSHGFCWVQNGAIFLLDGWHLTLLHIFQSRNTWNTKISIDGFQETLFENRFSYCLAFIIHFIELFYGTDWPRLITNDMEEKGKVLTGILLSC